MLEWIEAHPTITTLLTGAGAWMVTTAFTGGVVYATIRAKEKAAESERADYRRKLDEAHARVTNIERKVFNGLSTQVAEIRTLVGVLYEHHMNREDS